MIKIGSYTIPTRYILAPMAGCTDLPFRLICREHGAKFCFYEMVDTHSVIHHRSKALSILRTSEKDDPIALQLLGNDPDIILNAALELLPKLNVPFIDINAACPVKKVMKKKAGAYLLKRRDVLFKTIGLLRKKLNIPITVKMRLAHENETIEDIIEIAKNCEDSGAGALFIHGRTRTQFYAGEINYGALSLIKKNVKIPLICSGNILSPEMAARMFRETFCDGILIARGALGNPWIFRSIEQYIQHGTKTAPVHINMIKSTLIRHLSYQYEYLRCRQQAKIGLMRKTALWYMRSFPHAKRAREKICLVNSHEEMIKLIEII